MPKPLVYFVAESSVDLARVHGLGLGYAFDLGPERQQGPGPDGARGVRFTESGTGGPYSPPVWEPHADAADAWVGWDPADPPTVASLQRKRWMPGHQVPMADGREWHIPAAIHFPRRSKYEGQGRWSQGAHQEEEHRYLWSVVERIAAAIFPIPIGEGDQAVSVELPGDDELLGIAARALAVNYRLSAVEVSLLGLFDSYTVPNICRALCDFPARDLLRPSAHPNCEGPALERGPETSSTTSTQPPPTSTP